MHYLVVGSGLIAALTGSLRCGMYLHHATCICLLQKYKVKIGWHNVFLVLLGSVYFSGGEATLHLVSYRSGHRWNRLDGTIFQFDLLCRLTACPDFFPWIRFFLLRELDSRTLFHGYPRSAPTPPLQGSPRATKSLLKEGYWPDYWDGSLQSLQHKRKVAQRCLCHSAFPWDSQASLLCSALPSHPHVPREESVRLWLPWWWEQW